MTLHVESNVFVTYSCTSSSCEYWPPSGSNSIRNPSTDEKSLVNGSHNKNDSDSSGNNVRISVKQQATVVTVNGPTSHLKRVNKPINSSIIFLGDCEMPITTSVTRKNSGSDSSANKIAESKAKEIHPRKVQTTSRQNGEMKQQFAVSSQQTR